MDKHQQKYPGEARAQSPTPEVPSSESSDQKDQTLLQLFVYMAQHHTTIHHIRQFQANRVT